MILNSIGLQILECKDIQKYCSTFLMLSNYTSKVPPLFLHNAFYALILRGNIYLPAISHQLGALRAMLNMVWQII